MEGNDNSNSIRFYDVKTLRDALNGLPDDWLLMCQTVGQDGSAWNMHGSFCKQVQNGTIAVLTFDHPQLKTLPQVDFK